MTGVWPPGAGTGVGSLPGTDLRSALAAVLDELAEFPYLPELPQRGAGAELTGRSLAHLVDLHADIQPSGWRLVSRPGTEERRARDLLRADLDVLEEAAGQLEGPLKLQVGGPWTLAAGVELPRGDRVLADPGAVRDLTDSLAAGVGELPADVRRRCPRASLVLQLDEPGLPAVLTGSVPTASGFGRLAAVAPGAAREGLARVLSAVAGGGALPAVHCCAAGAPVALFAAAGARAVSLDLTAGRLDEDALGELLTTGGRLIAGTVPALDPPHPPSARQAGAPVRELWHRLGFDPDRLAGQVALSPTCGLAGASPQWAREAGRLTAAAARALLEEPVHRAGAP